MSLFTSACATLTRRLLAGGSAHVLGAAQTFLRDIMKRLVDEVEERLRKKAVSYVAAIALALVAAGSLVSALAEGFIALGMPPWASHLVLAVATGAAAWVCYVTGRARRVMPTGESDREEESDRAPRGVTIKIVNQMPRQKPRRKKRRVRNRRTKPRPSRKKVVKHPRVRAA
jgi:hypothetical protein